MLLDYKRQCNGELLLDEQVIEQRVSRFIEHCVDGLDRLPNYMFILSFKVFALDSSLPTIN